MPQRNKQPARDRVASRKSLEEAWHRTQRRAKKTSWEKRGPDGVSVADIQRNLDVHLRDLQTKIRADKYRFGQLSAHFIVKPNKKDRVICVPSVRDRLVQRSILGLLSNEHDPCRIINPISFGYVKDPDKTQKKAVEAAANLRTQHEWALKTDISAFFDRIPRDLLEAVVRRRVPYRSLHPMLVSAIWSEVYEPKRNRRGRLARAGLRRGVGVRQGMPLSPFFANVFLNDLDRQLQKSKIPTIRYADDLILFFDERDEAIAVFHWLSEELEKLQLSVPPLSEKGKSRVVAPRQTVEFLGADLAFSDGEYAPIASESLFQGIYERFTALSSAEAMQREDVTLFQLKNRLNGLKTSLAAAYSHCRNQKELQKKGSSPIRVGHAANLV